MIELHGMGEFWESAGQDVQEETLDRLVAFAGGLTTHHRENMQQFMLTNATGRGYAPKVFYDKLKARL